MTQWRSHDLEPMELRHHMIFIVYWERFSSQLSIDSQNTCWSYHQVPIIDWVKQKTHSNSDHKKGTPLATRRTGIESEQHP